MLSRKQKKKQQKTIGIAVNLEESQGNSNEYPKSLFWINISKKQCQDTKSVYAIICVYIYNRAGVCPAHNFGNRALLSPY